ncbi:hypothetical protein BTA51_14660 [Hahella sp. CCB-MM4]|uniref:hypothetical protein n=1 Tax=Hahella sp. (strain CCB-MM4) TaxID=1926491 RepID=UPI000B9C061F|nr:hypothetical protein [Hahella sp. CCB-MM4]OZG72761.1 hypothetical protein BTA51_14660 [Hahella sp. CCB-MM4]
MSKNKSDIFQYAFIESCTGRVLGLMHILKDEVDLNPEVDGAWSTNKCLNTILLGGIKSGLKFSFPDQRSHNLASGYVTSKGEFVPNDGEIYGSSDGKTINKGRVLGQIKGFSNGNELYVFTFETGDVEPPSIASSVTTLYNDAEKWGSGILQISENHEVHQDKYTYVGVWTKI